MSRSFFTRCAIPLVVLIWMAIGMVSCKTIQHSNYFRSVDKDTLIVKDKSVVPELKIQAGDNLAIFATSLNQNEDLLFNGAIAVQSDVSTKGYKVSSDGQIFLHRIGTLKAAGLTRRELKEKIEKSLLPYMKEPIVSVEFTNHYVTILGQVTQSKTINMPEERIRLLDVLATAADVTVGASLSNVMVIRETDTAQQIKRLNLEDASIFSSPYYYLQPKDVVVVNLDEKRLKAEEKKARSQQIYSYTISTISLLLIIIDRIFR